MSPNSERLLPKMGAREAVALEADQPLEVCVCVCVCVSRRCVCARACGHQGGLAARIQSVKRDLKIDLFRSERDLLST